MAGNQLGHLQKLACIYITGAMQTSPTAALEIIIGTALHCVCVKQEAMTTCYLHWIQTPLIWKKYSIH